MPKKSNKKKQEEIDESELEKEIQEEDENFPKEETEDFFEEEDKFVERVNLPPGSPVLERITELTQGIQEQFPQQDTAVAESGRQEDYANLIAETYRNYEIVGTTTVLRPVDRGAVHSEDFLNPLAGRGFEQNASQNMRIESEFVEDRHRHPFEKEEKKYRRAKF